MNNWIVRRSNVAPHTSVYYGPYSTEQDAQVARERLLRYQSFKVQNDTFKGHGVFPQFFNPSELVVEQVFEN